MKNGSDDTNENQSIEIKITLGARRTCVAAYDGVQLQPPVKNKNSSSTRSFNRSGPSPFAEFNYMRRLKERKNNFYAIIYNNFQASHSVMVTLTFSPQNPHSSHNFVSGNLAQAHAEFVKFIKRLNWYYEGFKYIAVFSRQQNGNWHYHMICNITDMTQTQWMKVWKLGFVWVSEIQTTEALRTKAIYCVKNMMEDAGNELHGENGYLCSHKLKRNLVFRSWNPDEEEECWSLFEQIKDKPCKELYRRSIPSGEDEEWTYYLIRSYKIFADKFSLLESAVRKANRKI